MNFAKLFDTGDFVKITGKIKKSDITTLMNVIEFERYYIHNIKRSQFKFYTSTLASLLSGCHLHEIILDPSCLSRSYFIEFYIYPKEIELALSALDGKQLSRDFERSSQRHWGNLLSLSILSQNIETDIIKILSMI